MKRKFSLLFIVLMLLLVVCAPDAYAANSDVASIRRSGNTFKIDPDDVPLVELPAAEIVKELAVAGDGSALISVGADEILETVETIASGEAVRVAVIAATSGEENGSAAASTINISMPRDALAAVAERTEADLQIVTDMGQMILPNSVIASIAEQASGKDVTFIMAHRPLDADNDPGASATEIDILCDGQYITSWDGGEAVLKLPVGAGHFEPDLSYRVIQTSADNTRNEHAGLCVEDASGLYAEISITHLSTFVVLAEAAKETARTPHDSMVLSPLAADIDDGNSGVPYMWIAAGGLALAACAAGGVMVKRRRDGKAR